ncbi:hypothetical protein C1N73_26995 (plasmid) [Priestia aryabhattai]
MSFLTNQSVHQIIEKYVYKIVAAVEELNGFYLEDKDNIVTLLIHNIMSFLQGSSFNCYLEEEIKETIMPFTYSEAFIRNFLKENLFVTEISDDVIKSFRKCCRIYFFNENKYKFKQKSRKYPSTVYLPPGEKGSSLNEMLKKSAHKEIKKIYLASVFSNETSQLKDLVLFIKKELDPTVKPILLQLQIELNSLISKFEEELRKIIKEVAEYRTL